MDAPVAAARQHLQLGSPAAMAQRKRKPPRLTLSDNDLLAGYPGHRANGRALAHDADEVHPTAVAAATQPVAAAAQTMGLPAPWSPIRSDSAASHDKLPSAVTAFLSTLPSSDDTAGSNGVATAPSNAHPAVSAAGTIDTTSASTSKRQIADKYKKRGRVESANFDELPSGRASSRSLATAAQPPATNGAVGSSSRLTGALLASTYRSKRGLVRAHSTPNLYRQADTTALTNIFPDINPRHLRIAEVKSWHCAWMDTLPRLQSPLSFGVSSQSVASPPLRMRLPRLAAPPSPRGSADTPPLVRSPHLVTHAPPADELDDVIHALANELALEDKAAVTPISVNLDVSSSAAAMGPQRQSVPLANTPPSLPVSRRPQLRLKLEDMPTPQQAEDRAQRAANRLIAKREAIEKAMDASGAEAATTSGGASATQSALLRLNFKSYSSGDDSDVQSPSDAGRHSAGSAYSPNHGMFTTKSVAVSEAGISSPDAACLHLQENLAKVREVGRGASGIVYKAIHIPTLKVVAIKDVPVYGRGQRRQMVRELHALHSNLVPICSERTDASDSSATPAARSTPSPYIVSFYDAFVDRPKNAICLVMEYMSTGSLQDIVLRGGCANEKILARLALGVLRGLAHIHGKRMLHRDIKPHNLLTNRHGLVKISDFGLARTLNDTMTSAKTFVGTLLYMAPERIGGGDYSYAADIWSFGLALISVAIGKYPLPTQDGFFGLVDSVANEKFLELPADRFSPECRSFVQECVRIDPTERPSAQALLAHPFVTMYSPGETLQEWTAFIEEKQLCEDRAAEVDALADAVYQHIYERCVKFSFQPQSDYGVSFLSQATPTFSRRQITIEPVQMSLQLGLANVLGVPAHMVYETFEAKRSFYCDKLLEDYCYSPQSWTASPGDARRQQLFGSDSESPGGPTARRKSSFWRKLQQSMAKLGSRRKRKDSEAAAASQRT